MPSTLVKRPKILTSAASIRKRYVSQADPWLALELSHIPYGTPEEHYPDVWRVVRREQNGQWFIVSTHRKRSAALRVLDREIKRAKREG